MYTFVIKLNVKYFTWFSIWSCFCFVFHVKFRKDKKKRNKSRSEVREQGVKYSIKVILFGTNGMYCTTNKRMKKINNMHKIKKVVHSDFLIFETCKKETWHHFALIDDFASAICRRLCVCVCVCSRISDLRQRQTNKCVLYHFMDSFECDPMFGIFSSFDFLFCQASKIGLENI